MPSSRAGGLEMTFDELKQKGFVKIPFSYRKYEDGGFRTPTGKIELYSTRMEEMGYAPLPYYEEPPESPVSAPESPRTIPLVLTTGGRISSSSTPSTARSRNCARRTPTRSPTSIPTPRKLYGIANGEWLYRDHARPHAPEGPLTAGIDPRVITAEHGWWFPEEPAPDTACGSQTPTCSPTTSRPTTRPWGPISCGRCCAGWRPPRPPRSTGKKWACNKHTSTRKRPMRIDAYTHFFPKRFFDTLIDVAGDTRTWASACAPSRRSTISTSARGSSTATRTMRRSSPTRSRRSKPCQEPGRRSTNSSASSTTASPNCRQGTRPFSRLGRADFARRAGRRRRRSRTRDQPAGRARRADLHQRRRQADRPAGIPAVLEENGGLDKPVWIHPARGAKCRTISREEVPLRNLVDLRLVLRDGDRDGASGLLEDPRRPPELKIITHHFGGIVPMLEGRIGPGWDVLGDRTRTKTILAAQEPEEAAARLFQAEFLCGYGRVRRVPATKCGLDFYQRDKIVFASDCPFDPEKGSMYPRLTLEF